jgi:hypothetical protein
MKTTWNIIGITLVVFFHAQYAGFSQTDVEILDSAKRAARPQISVSVCDIGTTTAILKVLAPDFPEFLYRNNPGIAVLSASIYYVYALASSNFGGPSFKTDFFGYYSIGCTNNIESIEQRFPKDASRVVFITLTDLQPGTSYQLLAEQSFILGSPRPSNSIDVIPIQSQRTDTVRFTTQPILPFAALRFYPTTLISVNGFTVGWAGLTTKPDGYTLELATDSLFRQSVQNASTRRLNDTSIAISGLQANTRYFYRIRAVRAGQSDILSSVGSERTLANAAMSSFTASEAALLDVVSSFRGLSFDGFCTSPSPHYAYATGASLSFAQMDSVLAVLLRAGIPVTQAWMQDNSTCDGKNNGTSELRIKLLVDNSRVRSFGFSKRYNDWASSCLCRKYRVYTNFVPTYVHQNEPASFVGNIAPNPASDNARLALFLPSSASVNMTLYDLLGRETRKISDGLYQAGTYEFSILFDDVPSGIYFLRCSINGQMFIRRVAVVK